MALPAVAAAAERLQPKKADKKSVFYTLFFCGRSRIQASLQQFIQVDCSHATLPGRSQDLNLFRKNAHILRQPSGAKTDNCLRCTFFRTGRQEEKVILHIFQLGHFAVIYPVGIHNDQTFLGLPENFRKTHCRQHLRAEHIIKGKSRTYRGQLIWVTHKDQPGASRYSLQQTT